ncbi:DNA internalization-related competence protein ComEC/Rec2 [Nitrincola alkalisediminis]|uniref:DNA internalization-related competence protein ComEC/Rec2 n=1 Tax=Nitrincola alkalisediminis TaxID=1366656 RepID=UPI001876B4A1|nr:DNA internalization-related competence protein ComEC/Rec2 [Nitrincola alkalisediminis]
MIVYSLGILAVSQLPSLRWALLLFACLPLVYFPRFRRLFIALALGVAAASIYGIWQLHHQLPDAYDRSLIEVTGRVIGLPKTTDQEARFFLQLTEVQHFSSDPHQRLRRLSLVDYRPETHYSAGETVTLSVSLRAPRSLKNPYAADLEAYYLYSGIDARGVVQSFMRSESQAFTLSAIREALKRTIYQQIQDEVSAKLLVAVVLGDRSDLRPEDWLVLQRTGTAHLLVVSGLHIGVVAALGLLIGRMLTSVFILIQSPSLLTRVLPLLFAFLLAITYACLAGLSLPVQRALIMVCVFLIGEFRFLQLSAWQRLKWALVIIITLQPLAVIQAGALLSFVAVALLLWVSDSWKSSGTSNLVMLARVQGYIFIGMLPLVAVFFQQISLIAPIVNFVAVPIFSLFIMLLPFLIVLQSVEVPFVSDSVQLFLSGFWWCLDLASSVDFATVILPVATEGVIALAVAAVGLCLLPMPVVWKLPLVMMAIVLFFPDPKRPEQGEFRAVVFDVGQGLSVLVQTHSHQLLFDTGPGFFSGGSAWSYTVSPWFKANTIDHLQHLVISHNDLDHSGALEDLFTDLNVSIKESGSPYLQAQGFDSCHSRRSWSYDGVDFRYLTREPNDEWSENDRSCVLEVRTQHCSLLLTGDVSKRVEYDLVRRSEVAPVTWLVAGHHGSDTSSSDVFIERTQPRAVIYTAGFNNRYGHPAPAVRSRFQRVSIQELNTAWSGALHLYSERGECHQDSERQRKRRYWTRH